MTILKPFQLLELNVISAQELEPVQRRKMRTYAEAWIHPKRKLSTRIDNQGHINPTWNDKFVFRVDDDFLHCDTSAVTIEIYAAHWLRDIHVGTVRVIVGNLLTPINRNRRRHDVQLGMRFVALHVWRPSGRPQGILNIGVALLDSSMRSMPLYMQMGSSAVGYRHLMGEELQSSNNNNPSSTVTKSIDTQQNFRTWPIQSELRRTKSDSSSIVESEAMPKGSIINDKINSRGSSMVNYTFEKGKTGKPSSIINGSTGPGKKSLHTEESSKNTEKDNNGEEKTVQKGTMKSATTTKSPRWWKTIYWTDSEVGPSASEVAANMAMNTNLYRMEETESSIVDEWSLDESMEGLRSKLERWKTELPPVYDRGDVSGTMSSDIPTTSSKSRHIRRHTVASANGGLFSCFGNICGCEISITCGPTNGAADKKKGKFRRNSSIDTWSSI